MYCHTIIFINFRYFWCAGRVSIPIVSRLSAKRSTFELPAHIGVPPRNRTGIYRICNPAHKPFCQRNINWRSISESNRSLPGCSGTHYHFANGPYSNQDILVVLYDYRLSRMLYDNHYNYFHLCLD